jgi:L-asparagine transporter-like permease
MKSKNTMEQTLKDIKKWMRIIILWIIILILTIIFSNQPTTLIIGVWFLIIGLFLAINRKKYENWYNKNYDNIKKIEEENKNK